MKYGFLLARNWLNFVPAPDTAQKEVGGAGRGIGASYFQTVWMMSNGPRNFGNEVCFPWFKAPFSFKI